MENTPVKYKYLKTVFKYSALANVNSYFPTLPDRHRGHADSWRLFNVGCEVAKSRQKYRVLQELLSLISISASVLIYFPSGQIWSAICRAVFY